MGPGGKEDTMSNIKITRTTTPKAKPDQNHLGFGKYYTDHMLIIDYTAGIGWHDARIVALRQSGDPSGRGGAPLRHRDLRGPQGLPPPRRQGADVPPHGERSPHEQLRPPHVPAHHGRGAGPGEPAAFVELEQDWVPSAPGTSLYLRPFMIATEPNLAVHTAKEDDPMC